ncbi:hypothetical protein BGX38DRAFT_1270816 [Terfezia claveryi]|nr:hypothetical protein BGX38DRAFT_1270816 [Terfezia claveryi]
MQNRKAETSSRAEISKYLFDQQADYPCKDIEQRYLLKSLSGLCDRTDSVNEGFLSAGRESLFLSAIQWFKSRNWDFGRAYSMASTVFVKVSLNDKQIIPEVSGSNFMMDVMNAVKVKKQEEVRNKLGDTEFISSPYKVLPRRIWDVRSNRVIPFDFLAIKSIQLNPCSGAWEIKFLDTDEALPEFWAVSHSWAKDPKLTYTRANRMKWPVPIPQSIRLDGVRHELILFGAKYVWLDILCLRQTCAGAAISDELLNKREEKRKQEWKLDVPTIGNIYQIVTIIVRYFNGLGCKFNSQNWGDPRHWLQRAWTLQEIRSEEITYNGGVSDTTNVWNTEMVFDDNKMTLRQVMQPLWDLAQQLEVDQGKSHGEIYRLAKEMGRRYAASDLDKISGIIYLLRTTSLPTYLEGTLPSEAWEKCFHVLAAQTKLELLFEFPYVGDDGKWFPSWDQLLSWPERNQYLRHLTRGALLDIKHSAISGCCHYNSKHRRLLLIEGVYILPNVTIQHSTEVKGEYVVRTSQIRGTNDGGRTRLIPSRRVNFQSVYLNQMEIPDGIYFLATPMPNISHNWVVCEQFLGWTGGSTYFCPGDCIRKLGAQVFRKIGVLRTDYVVSLTGPDSTLEKRSKCLFI